MENQLVAHDDQLPMTSRECMYSVLMVVSLLIAAFDLKVLFQFNDVRGIVGIIALFPLCVLAKISLQNSLIANEARTKRGRIDALKDQIFLMNNHPVKTKPERHPEWEQLLFLIGSYNQLVGDKAKINGILVVFAKHAEKPKGYHCSLIEHDPHCAQIISKVKENGDWDCYTYLT
ncbi:hypothetical protein IPF86_01010 [Candidatus Nomurabacteria bacterium]|nr:MAG: hypothetical protein IPF86_01010 [Candidatus Nomurabacteria bacterium]